MMSQKRAYYSGLRMAPYDLVKEALLALAAVTTVVVILAAFLSSPDVPSLTMQSVAKQAPQSFVQNAVDSLSGSSDIATYGPPYNDAAGASQSVGPVSLQSAVGVHLRIDTAHDFVLGPLTQASGGNSAIRAALNRYTRASKARQTAWTDAYGKALTRARAHGALLAVPKCATCGPVPLLMTRMLDLGQTGALDGILLAGDRFYQTDYTRSLLFLSGTSPVDDLATKYNLQGDQWGVMNETGNYPGQAWLWLFTVLYQIPAFANSPNVDALAVVTISVLSLLLLLLPWIPVLNQLPRYLKVYRLIWRDFYREQETRVREA